MSNGFELHGIAHLSASQINLYRAAPALWVMEKLMGWRSPGSVAMNRGTAVESGIELGLQNPQITVEECQKRALSEFDRMCALKSDPKKEDERAAIPAMVEVGLKELRQYGQPTDCADTRQHRIEIKLDGVSVPLIGFLDFLFDKHGIIVDLKTTHRIPSEISGSHALQGAIYKNAMNNYDMRFAYVSAKKISVYSLDADTAREKIEEARQVALRMERFLRLSKDAQELAGLLCPDFESFYWNDAVTRAKGREVYGF